MGSREDSQYKDVDPTVGGLVWVRRRNGSWWPGQIIAEDECGDSSTASPRVGTPIKLLGRDDVSVDWYNLERSKRVKPFRCGEYKNCIAKAKRAALISRKAVKYARREDAIIEALEIEMKQKALNADNEIHVDEDISDCEGNTYTVNGALNQVTRPRRTPNDDDEDGTEGVKRMRDLDDLGMGPAQGMKRKRTQVSHVHEFLKKKNRSRPLIKVLESSAVVDPFVPLKDIPNEFDTIELNGSSSVVINNSDSIGVSREDRNMRNGDASGSVFVSCKAKDKETFSISAIPEKDKSENLFDVPLVAKKPPVAGTAKTSYQTLRVAGKQQSSESSEDEDLGNEESVSTSSGAAYVDSVLGMKNSTSRWQSKGRRNSRTNRTRKPNIKKISDVDDDYNENLDEYWGQCGRSSSKLSSLGTPRALPYRQSRSMMNPKYGGEFSLHNRNDDNDDEEEEEEEELYNVDIEVKAASQRRHVPFISLMSKLTGQPVVGHPIAVEILEDGYTSGLVREAQLKGLSDSSKSHRGVSPIKPTKLGRSSPSIKKIRKLSSLTGFNKVNEGERRFVAEKITGSGLACVPLKIIYSRINAGWKEPPRHVVQPRER